MTHGLGLIELIVALLVSTIVLIAVATILVNSWLTQQDVTSTTQATTRGQLIGQSIERAMRNAVAFDISPDGSDAPRPHARSAADANARHSGSTGGASYMTSTAGSLPVARCYGVATAVGAGWRHPERYDAILRTIRIWTVTYTFDIAYATPRRLGSSARVSMRTASDRSDAAMLELKSFRPSSPRRGARHADDEGAVLVTVVVVMFVGFVIATVIAASRSFSPFQANASNKSTTQAFIAAESGRDVRRVSDRRRVLATHRRCTLRAHRRSSRLMRRSVDGGARPSSFDDAGLTSTCPTADTDFVVIRSTGTGSRRVGHD